MEFTKYYELIRAWAEERNILNGSSKKAQFTKLMEEYGEIELDPRDGIGDSLVVLVIIAAQCGLNLEMLKPRYLNGGSYFQRFGMLASDICKNRDAKVSIQYVYGVILQQADIHGEDVNACLSCAWNEIKDRKGRMINGTFVKEADIK